MNWFVKKRGEGKTTALVYTSAVTGYPIIVTTRNRVKLIQDRAKQLNLEIPDPIIFERGSCMRLYLHGQKVLIDEAKPLIKKALEDMLECEVAAVTMSITD